MYKQKYCINDVVEQCELSTSNNEYIKKIMGKIFYKGNYYVPKEILINVLTKSKAPKSKELLDFILYNKEDEITSKEIINFVDNGKNIIHFDFNMIKYVYVEQQAYFKAKDIALALGYADTEQPVKHNVDDTDKLTVFDIKGPVNNTGPRKTNEQTKMEQILGNEDGKTIFINESGLYSLILGSKKPEAKKFKHWITSEVLPTIRKYGTYTLTDKLEYSMDKLDYYEGHEIVYLINIQDNLYKYGQTYRVYNRMAQHSNELNFNHIVKLYKVDNRSVSLACEAKMKKLCNKLKIISKYNNGKEFFRTTGKYSIDNIVQYMDDIVSETNLEYKNKSHEVVPLADVAKLFELHDKLKETVDKAVSNEKLINLLIDKIKNLEETNKSTNEQINLILEKLSINEEKQIFVKEKELFYQVKLKELEIKIKELDFLIVKAKNPSVIQQLIDAKIIGDNVDKSISLELDIGEVIEEKSAERKRKLKTNCTLKKIINKEPTSNIRTCAECGCEVASRSIRCNGCVNREKLKKSIEVENKDRPSLNQITEDLGKLGSYLQVGKKYGVSDNCIRKWITRHKKYAKLFSIKRSN